MNTVLTAGATKRRVVLGALVGRECPRQQFVDAVDRVFGDAFEHVTQIRFRIDVR